MARIIDLKKKGYQGPRPYQVDYFEFGKRKRVHFKTDKEAQRFLTTIEAEILKAKEGLLPDWFFNGNDEELTIGELYKRYVEEEIDLKPKESAQVTAKRILNGTIQKFGDIKATQLEVSKVNEYRREWLKEKKGKETSFQTMIKGLKTMLNWGAKNGYIVRNPLKSYEFKKGIKSKEKEALDDDQIKRFILALKENSPEFLDYFILGVNTGMRIAELWSLEWEQVDIEKRTLDLPEEKTKTNKARRVPLNNACMDVINRLYVKRPYAPHVLWHPYRANLITEEVGRLSKRFLGKRHTPHYWRVTFATRTLRGKRIKAENGQIYWVRGDLKTVAEIGGWDTDSKILVSIYQKVSEEQKHETVDLVGIGETDILPESRDFNHAIDTNRHLIPAKA